MSPEGRTRKVAYFPGSFLLGADDSASMRPSDKTRGMHMEDQYHSCDGQGPLLHFCALEKRPSFPGVLLSVFSFQPTYYVGTFTTLTSYGVVGFATCKFVYDCVPFRIIDCNRWRTGMATDR